MSSQSKKSSIQNKLMRVIMLVSGIVVLMTCAAFFLYEYYSFRESTLQKTKTLGEIISNNSTAALAFENKEEAEEILSALKAEPHITEAGIYDINGKLFCSYPSGYNPTKLPLKPGLNGYNFGNSSLEGFQPIVEGNKQLGTLFLKSDLKAMYKRFELYTIIVLLVLNFSFLLAFFLSRFLQKGISTPILALAETAKAISERKDYSVRATKLSDDELGSLTDAFNQMLIQIQGQTRTLNQFNQELENKVNERTMELGAAYKELESFSYSVSHDLRAPLRALNGYSKIILEDYGSELNDDVRKLLGNIQFNSQKMGTLIDDLLSFSKLGKKEITKKEIDIKEMVTKVVEETGSNYRAKIQIDSLPKVMGDYSLLYQVWINLTSNALKYSAKKDNPEITIGSTSSGSETIFFIKDNGAGFDMKYYNKLFGVFQRLHDTKDFEGTGIGLAIVNRIITKHRGRVWAEGKLEEGSTFYFALPDSAVENR